MTLARPILYHIPVCPFSQRLEILLSLKSRSDGVEFRVVDITRPRDPDLLRKTGGSTALPILETESGEILRESLVILEYLDETIEGPHQRRRDPLEHAVEQMLIGKEGPFVSAGYRFLMNQDPGVAEGLRDVLLGHFADLNRFLKMHNRDGTFLFDEFGLAEAVFTPIFMRFWFLGYYEAFELPNDHLYARVRRWRDGCLAHPAAQQTRREEVIKLYYDYALGSGNGALPPGRQRSSFVFEPHWRDRPWPPRTKFQTPATDAQLGLL